MDFIDVIDEIVKTKQVFHSILEGNEAQTRWMLIDPLLLDGLGYSRKDIIVEYNLENINSERYNKLDYSILLNNVPVLLVEAKSLETNLYSKYEQLEDYFLTILKRYNFEFECDSLIGILTNGDDYLFYTNSENKNRMDFKPFYTIKLSSSENFERLKLLQYSKDKLSNTKNISLISSDEEYDLNESYRIDMVENVLNYFKSKNISVEIDGFYLNGRYKKIKNFRGLYRELLKQINNLKPSFLYNIALEEDMNSNSQIISKMFSLNYINSAEIKVSVEQGTIHVSIPNNDSGLIRRIIYLANISGYGIQNILVKLK